MNGWIYVATHPLTPANCPRAKIGFSAIQVAGDHADSRLNGMNFWLEVFGLGKAEIPYELYHSRAGEIETRLKRRLNAQGKRAKDCGTSTETFCITSQEARHLIEQIAEEIDASEH